MLLEVLFEIGNDPTGDTELLSSAVRDRNTEVVRRLLDDPRVDPDNTQSNLLAMAARGRPEMLKILLADGRTDPADDEENYILSECVEEHWTECLQILLADPRVDLSVNKNQILLIATKFGYADIVELLLADERVIEADVDTEDDFGIEGAVLGSHVETLKLILQHPIQDINLMFMYACRGSSYETVKLLFDEQLAAWSASDNKSVLPTVSENYPLKMARNGKRQDVVELLLTDERVRVRDEAVSRGERWWD